MIIIIYEIKICFVVFKKLINIAMSAKAQKNMYIQEKEIDWLIKSNIIGIEIGRVINRHKFWIHFNPFSSISYDTIILDIISIIKKININNKMLDRKWYMEFFVGPKTKKEKNQEK